MGNKHLELITNKEVMDKIEQDLYDYKILVKQMNECNKHVMPPSFKDVYGYELYVSEKTGLRYIEE